ncbi:MAG: DUF4252 domain-containing protein [Candidatus Solibacter sp.]
MDWLEQELTQALARKQPAAGFDARVRARLQRRPQWLAIAAALLVMVGAGEAWQQYRGHQAKEQVMAAMRIAGGTLESRASAVERRRPMKLLPTAVLLASLSATLWAQQFQFNLDHLKDKASESADIALNADTLGIAARFLDSKDPDEAKVKKLILGIEGIYIKHFEFKSSGAWSATDLDRVRVQLKGPEWSRIVGVKSGDSENIEVWMRTEKGKVSGVAILASEPRQLTVANLVGNIDIESLAELGGHFGLPKLQKK